MSIATALARSHSAKVELIRQAVQAALDKAGLSYANAVLLFLSPHFARDPQMALHEAARVAGCLQVDGCIGAGLFTEQGWSLGEPAAAAMVLGGDIQLRRARPSDSPIFSLAAPQSLNLTWLENGVSAQADAGKADITESSQSRSGTPRFGVVASDSDGQGPFKVWSGGRVQAEGRCDLAFDGARMRIGLSQGARPLSIPQAVTQVDGNDVLAVGGHLALGSLASALPQLNQEMERMPLHLFMAGVTHGDPTHALEEGRYQMMPIVSANADTGSVTVPVLLTPGDQLFWAVRQPQAAEQDMQTMLDRLDSDGLDEPAFGLFFPCLGRGPSFYGGEDRDLATIVQRYSDMPLIGIYGNGEIAPLDGKNRLLQYSAVLGLGYV